jgi:DNA polymerase-3 subunit epsilon
MREIALDTETTGISAQQGHRVIEIGAVEMINHFRTGKHFHAYINPQRPVDEGAFKVHGISDDFLKDKPLFKDIVSDFLEFIGDSRLVIHNAPFDIGFLNHHLHQLGVGLLQNDRVLDTLELARKKFPGAKNSLDALCNRFSIDLSAREKHGALLDSELLADVYAEMIGAGANQRNLMFAQEKAAQQKVQASIKIVRQETYEARTFTLTEEEQQAHDAFVAKLKDPLWQKAN